MSEPAQKCDKMLFVSKTIRGNLEFSSKKSFITSTTGANVINKFSIVEQQSNAEIKQSDLLNKVM